MGSIVQPIPKEKASHCGYCDTDGSISFGMWAFSLTAMHYQRLIDRGWRRSGQYLYKSEMKETCCPLYTIRLDTTKFKISKSQKKTKKKMEKFLQGTLAQHEMMEVDEEEEPHARPQPQKEKQNQKQREMPGKPKPMDISQKEGEGDLGKGKEKEKEQGKEQGKEKGKEQGKEKKPEKGTTSDQNPGLNLNQKRKLEIVLEPAQYSDEKFALFERYQTSVHEDDSTKTGFTRFLITSPLKVEKLPNHPEHPGYGSFHQLYRVDGKLIAVGVIDILPFCVSSVYFFYDPDLSFLSLGVFSALTEIELAQKLMLMTPELKYYYLGFYVHTCPKMKYKGQYRPSDLLDPVSYKWAPLTDCIPLLEKNKYSRFEKNEQGQVKKDSEHQKEVIDFNRIPILAGREATLLGRIRSPDLRPYLEPYAERVGPELATELFVKF